MAMRSILWVMTLLAIALLWLVPAAAQQTASADNGTVFLRIAAPLDEPRGLCVDIPGHRDRVNVGRPLVVYTCKWNIWNRDERFDKAALSKGLLRMPEYKLCAGLANASDAIDGARVTLGACDGASARRWLFADQRLRLAAATDLCLTVGPEPSKLTPGGRRLPSRHVARSLGLAKCDWRANDRQRWVFVAGNR